MENEMLLTRVKHVGADRSLNAIMRKTEIWKSANGIVFMLNAAQTAEFTNA